MRDITVRVHNVERDGLPDMDRLVGRVALLWDGNIVNGWPLSRNDEEGVPIWEGNSDVSRPGQFHKVTHWVEFPEPLWELESDAAVSAEKEAEDEAAELRELADAEDYNDLEALEGNNG